MYWYAEVLKGCVVKTPSIQDSLRLLSGARRGGVQDVAQAQSSTQLEIVSSTFFNFYFGRCFARELDLGILLTHSA